MDENSEEFISGNPDSLEDQNKDITEEIENDFEPNNEEEPATFEREIIKTPEYSRWDLLKPKKNNAADVHDKKLD